MKSINYFRAMVAIVREHEAVREMEKEVERAASEKDGAEESDNGQA
jgi:hypothetical protein